MLSTARSAVAPATDFSSRGGRVDRETLIERTEVDSAFISELVRNGLLSAGPGGFFDEDAVRLVEAAAALANFGLESRHLRAFKISADREAGLVAQIAGHANPTVTLGHYTQAVRDGSAAIEALELPAPPGALPVLIDAVENPSERVRRADLLIVIGARLGEMTTSGYTLLESPRPRQALVHVHPGAEELGIDALRLGEVIYADADEGDAANRDRVMGVNIVGREDTHIGDVDIGLGQRGDGVQRIFLDDGHVGFARKRRRDVARRRQAHRGRVIARHVPRTVAPARGPPRSEPRVAHLGSPRVSRPTTPLAKDAVATLALGGGLAAIRHDPRYYLASVGDVDPLAVLTHAADDLAGALL